MEQRWFIGAHTNVGGGYDRDALFLRPLQWIHCHAKRAGLDFVTTVDVLREEFFWTSPRDPLAELGLGAYYLLQRPPFTRHIRTVSLEEGTTNETLDYTVLEKWLWGLKGQPQCYRPPALSLSSRSPLLPGYPEHDAPFPRKMVHESFEVDGIARSLVERLPRPSLKDGTKRDWKVEDGGFTIEKEG